jgi:rare lipoprotein A
VIRARAGGLLLLAIACQRDGAAPPPAHASSTARGSSDEPALAVNGSGVNHVRAPRREELAQRYAGAPALKVFVGRASYYSDRFAGKGTASGESYDPSAFTGAHRTLPFGSVVRVVRTDVARTTYVKINDRGPFGGRGRILDVSRAAAAELDMLGDGVVPVRVEVVRAAH